MPASAQGVEKPIEFEFPERVDDEVIEKYIDLLKENERYGLCEEKSVNYKSIKKPLW